MSSVASLNNNEDQDSENPRPTKKQRSEDGGPYPGPWKISNRRFDFRDFSMQDFHRFTRFRNVAELKRVGADSEKPLRVERSWMTMLDKLVEYEGKHGDTNVPSHYEDRELVAWIAEQRKNYMDSSLPAALCERLKKLGFDFHTTDKGGPKDDTLTPEAFTTPTDGNQAKSVSLILASGLHDTDKSDREDDAFAAEVFTSSNQTKSASTLLTSRICVTDNSDVEDHPEVFTISNDGDQAKSVSSLVVSGGSKRKTSAIKNPYIKDPPSTEKVPRKEDNTISQGLQPISGSKSTPRGQNGFNYVPPSRRFDVATAGISSPKVLTTASSPNKAILDKFSRSLPTTPENATTSPACKDTEGVGEPALVSPHGEVATSKEASPQDMDSTEDACAFTFDDGSCGSNHEVGEESLMDQIFGSELLSSSADILHRTGLALLFYLRKSDVVLLYCLRKSVLALFFCLGLVVNALGISVGIGIIMGYLILLGIIDVPAVNEALGVRHVQ